MPLFIKTMPKYQRNENLLPLDYSSCGQRRTDRLRCLDLHSTNPTKVAKNLWRLQLVVSGVIVVLGCVLLDIVAHSKPKSVGYRFGCEISLGIFLIIANGVWANILFRKKKTANRCVTMTAIILSILAVVVSLGLIVESSFELREYDSKRFYHEFRQSFRYMTYSGYITISKLTRLISLKAAIVALAAVHFLSAVLSLFLFFTTKLNICDRCESQQTNIIKSESQKFATKNQQTPMDEANSAEGSKIALVQPPAITTSVTQQLTVAQQDIKDLTNYIRFNVPGPR